MGIYEFADIIRKDIIIRRYANQKGRFIAEFENCEIKKNKDDSMLSGGYGEGKTPEMAVNDYLVNISGKLLVFGAYTKDMQEFQVPALIKNPR